MTVADLAAEAKQAKATPTDLKSPAGFRAWVKIGGVATPVYQPKDGGKKASCYIESQEGQEFEVCFEDGRPYRDGLAACLYLDGTQIESFAFDPNSASNLATWNGKRVSDISIRPFTFAKVELTDDADLACDDETYVKALGTIEVRVCRVRYLGTRLMVGRTYVEIKPKVMNEKSKKAVLSHQTGLGAAKYTPPTGICDVQWIEQPETPYFTFEFTYRSRALLELNSIVPSEADAGPVAGSSQPKHKKRAATGMITIDSSDDEAPVVKQQPLKKKVKSEGGAVKGERGEVIVIDD